MGATIEQIWIGETSRTQRATELS